MSQEKQTALIVTYRRGPRTQRNSDVVVRIVGVNSAEEASRFIGKAITYTTPNKVLKGKIVRVHGRSGSLLARFNPGLPGQALGTEATIII